LAFGMLALYAPVFASVAFGVTSDNPILCDNYLEVSAKNSLVNWAAWSVQFGVWLSANYWFWGQSLTLFFTIVLKIDPRKVQKKI